MIIGYNEGVNKIVIITNDNKKMSRKLGVKGLNIVGKNYTYYNSNMKLHILNTDYIKEIICYKDNKKIGVINCEIRN